MKFGNRLKSIRNERNMTQKDVASAIGVTSASVHSWEINEKTPSMSAIISLSKLFQISSDEILGISQTPISKEERTLLDKYHLLDNYGKEAVITLCNVELKRIKESVNTVEFAHYNCREIRHYFSPSAAGINAPIDCSSYEIITVGEDVPFSADYAVDIRGDSMFPYISDGDTVYVKQTETLSIGDVGIFNVDGAMYCKQYYIAPSGALILASANEELKHTNIVISQDSSQSVSVLGKVLIGRKIPLPSYLFEEQE